MRRLQWLMLLIALLVLLLIAPQGVVPQLADGPGQAPASTSPPLQASAPLPAAEEQLLVEGDSATDIQGVWASSDGRRLGWIARRKGRSSVVVDGKEGPAFDQVRNFVCLVGDFGLPTCASAFVFSPDRRHFAYVAKTSNKKWVMVVDHQPGPVFEDVGVLRPSSFGTPAFQQIPFPVFSRDSRHSAYPARNPDKKVVMVVDGEPGPPCDQLSLPVFSPDSRHLAYAAKRGNKWRTILDGKEDGPEFDGIEADDLPIFSPDSQRLAYAGYRGRQDLNVKPTIGLDGKEFVPESGSVFSFAFTPDSRFAYLACGPEQCRLMLEGKPQGEAFRGCDRWIQVPVTGYIIASSILSRDGRRSACAAKHGKAWAMVADGKEGPEWAGIMAKPVFSPDSQHLAYLAKGSVDGATKLVLDGTATEPIIPSGSPGTIKVKYQSVAQLSFSPDSRRLACVLYGEPGGGGPGSTSYVVVDGVAQIWVSGVKNPAQVVFSPDSRRYAFRVYGPLPMFRNPQVAVVADGNAGKAYDEIIPESLQFPDANSLTYIARSGKKWYRVTPKLP